MTWREQKLFSVTGRNIIFKELTEKCDQGAVGIQHDDGEDNEEEHQEDVGEEDNLSSGGDPDLTWPTAAGTSESEAPHVTTKFSVGPPVD